MFHINNHNVGGNSYVTLENILFSSLKQEVDEHHQQDQHHDDGDDDQTDNNSETSPILMMSSMMRMNHDYNSFQREKQQKHASTNDDGTFTGGATSTPCTDYHSRVILGSILVLLLAMDVSLRMVSIIKYYDDSPSTTSSNYQQLSRIMNTGGVSVSRSNGHRTAAGDDGCSSSTTTTTTSRQNRRWVPVGDILNSTMTSDKSDTTTLKYATDIQNSAKNGLQGLAYDKDTNMLYQVHTMSIRLLQFSEANDDDDDDNNMIKIDSVSKTRMYTPDDFPSLEQNLTVTHIGGIDLSYSKIHGQELWMAIHSDGIHGVGGIVAVDTSTLLPKHDRKMLTSVNIDWVVHNNGILYYGGFFNVHSIRRVQLDTLEQSPDLVLDCANYPHMDLSGGLNYIQSGAFDDDGNLVLLGDDYQSTIYYVDVESGHILSHQGLLVGGETDGITFYNPPKSKNNNKSRRRNKHTTSSSTTSSSSMLVGLNRLHSHEQVMGDEPMVSIIQLEQLQ